MIVSEVIEKYCFELWGFDNDYIILKNKNNCEIVENMIETNKNETDDVNEGKKCECFVFYSCRFITRLSDMYIKHKSE